MGKHNLRQAARGRECAVRIPGICSGDTETTVLAHYSMPGLSGRGFKSPDLIGAWCCDSCHAAVDGRTKTDIPRDTLRLWFAEGVMRTQVRLLESGLIRA